MDIASECECWWIKIQQKFVLFAATFLANSSIFLENSSLFLPGSAHFLEIAPQFLATGQKLLKYELAQEVYDKYINGNISNFQYICRIV